MKQNVAELTAIYCKCAFKSNLHYLSQGRRQNLPTEGLELLTGGLKWIENAVFIRHLANFPPTRKNPKSPPTGGGARCF